MALFRIHALGVPHTITSEKFNACAYTQKVLKFCKMMTERGHHVIHYGHEDSELICSEHVSVLSRDTWGRVYGEHDYTSKFFTYDTNDDAYQEFYANAIKEIERRKEPLDILLPFWGWGVKDICDAHSDMIVIEPGIGYADTFAKFKVYESYALMHALGGKKNVSSCHPDWYGVVIPNYFDLKDFKFYDKKEDYMLFIGRVYDGKGVNIAIQVCEKLGVKLKIAGQLSDEYRDRELPSNVEFVGYADIDQRKELMGKAMGVFVPSLYNEPFGGVQVEALLSGTPTITTDWGAFTENNIEGVTGYRCRTFADFLNATISITNGKINYSDCRKQGEKFSLESVAPMYEKYFEDVVNVYSANGWYEEKKGVSFVVRCRNEEENIEKSIRSLSKLSIPHEFVVILHKCTDRSEKIVTSLKEEGFNIRIIKDDDELSKAGFECLVTPKSNKNSPAARHSSYYKKAIYKWKFIWDADFFARKELVDFLNQMDLNNKKSIRYSIGCKLGDGVINTQQYLSNCLEGFSKHLFWEASSFKEGSIVQELGCLIDSVKVENKKPYWREERWFKKSDKDLEKKYKQVVKLLGKEPIGMAAASNPDADICIKKAIELEGELKKIGINIYE